MDRRFLLFLVISFGILLGYSSLMQQLHPRQPAPPAPVGAAANGQAKVPDKKPSAEKREGKAEKEVAKAPPAVQAAPEPEQPEKWVTLGSAEPDPSKNPYRMLVTLTTKGAALARIELSSERYRDVDDRSGYLGNLVLTPDAKGGLVRVVGPGTPAAEAGLKPGDVLKSAAGRPVSNNQSLEDSLKRTRPNQTITLTVVRDGKELSVKAKLRRRPLDVVSRENDDPLSMLLTLQRFDNEKIAPVNTKGAENAKADRKHHVQPRDAAVDQELKGVRLRTANWRLVAADQSRAEFRKRVPQLGLELTKTYRLVEVPKAARTDPDFPAYHLEFEIAIRNLSDKIHKVAYRLDGPNGLPKEGAWYASKVSRNWGGSGLRDFVISFGEGTPGMVNTSTIAAGKDLPVWPDTPPDKLLTFIGVDAQYFSAVLIPERPTAGHVRFDELTPICVGEVDSQQARLANVSCRLTSVVTPLEAGQTLRQKFKLFAGPKRPALLENKQYNLGELVYYGWPIFAAVAVPLTKILHGLYFITWNYGLAIILLTVLVRGLMFPLSLKQAAGARKMQLLQPEMKKIAEKYKNNAEARTKAQQELFRKHNYNPMSGCLPIFIQMPIFIGLYRCLMVDIELRDAPLISHAIRWCSNLAAPDMLFNWSQWMPAWFNEGNGMFALGPYFNLLPLLTIGLMIWQQKMFMPPPADEQAAMQQKMMNFMMIFMGLLFFKVASGLCIYFIASSLWGLGERRFLPKTAPSASGPVSGGASKLSPNGSGDFGETRAQAKARSRETSAKKK